MHPIRALYDREAWATGELLRRCAELDPAPLERETPGTRGTIPRTLTHILGTGQFLLGMLGRPVADPIASGEVRDLASLAPVAEDIEVRWRELLDSVPDPAAWIVMVQYLHHGDTHRAHVGSVLGAAGVQPPRLDGWTFGRLDPTASGPAGSWADALLLRVFDHTGWAVHEALEHCLGLGVAALAATAPGTYGTAQETLTHLIDAHAGYAALLLGAEDVELRGAAEPDVLREWADRGRERWRGYLEAGPDHERQVPTPSRPAPAWVITLQAVHHANDHLAHVGTILGAGGLPVPDVDAWAYGATQGAAGG